MLRILAAAGRYTRVYWSVLLACLDFLTRSGLLARCYTGPLFTGPLFTGPLGFTGPPGFTGPLSTGSPGFTGPSLARHRPVGFPDLLGFTGSPGFTGPSLARVLARLGLLAGPLAHSGLLAGSPRWRQTGQLELTEVGWETPAAQPPGCRTTPVYWPFPAVGSPPAPRL